MADTPLLRKKRVLGAKTETTVGTAITPTGTDATFNVYDAEIQQGAAFIQRPGQSSFSMLPGVLGPLMGTCKFKIMAIGGASLPLWASVLLPACQFTATALVVKPETNAPGVGKVKTLTLGMFENGTYKQIHGAMGSWIWTFKAGEPSVVEFAYTGVWDAVADAAILTPTYDTVIPPLFSSSGLSLTSAGGSFTPRLQTLTINSGGQVVMRDDGASAGGYLSALITARRMVGTMDPESRTVANYGAWGDLYGVWQAGTLSSVAWSIGTTGNKIAFSCPALQFTNPQEGNRNDMQTDTAEFQLGGSAAAGDDEFQATWS